MGGRVWTVQRRDTGGSKSLSGFAERYPDNVRAIHRENSGHGGAVNVTVQYDYGAAGYGG